MKIECIMLVLSVILGLIHILLSAHAASLQVGYTWTATAKEARLPLTGVAGRLERALRNFLETFPFFATAVILVFVTHRHHQLSVIGSMMYFIARVIYLPLYAFGVPLIRSLVWNVATIGIVLVLLSLLVSPSI